MHEVLGNRRAVGLCELGELSDMTKNRNVQFVDFVELVESPSKGNPFYVVKSEKGNHYVSGLGGTAAKGMREGSKLALYRSQSQHISAYHLERA